jgi:hypothetical protein
MIEQALEARLLAIQLAVENAPAEILNGVARQAAIDVGHAAASNGARVSIKASGHKVSLRGKDAKQYQQMLTMAVGKQIPAATQQIRANIIAAAKS